MTCLRTTRLSVPPRPMPHGSLTRTRIALTQERANTQARQFWQRAAWTRAANVTNLQTAERPTADARRGPGNPRRHRLRQRGRRRYPACRGCPICLVHGVIAGRSRAYPTRSTVAMRVTMSCWADLAADDEPPLAALRREIMRLEPQQVYFPLGIGGHVDHVLCREAAVSLLHVERGWVMPGPDLADRVSFYEDFPYAWWNDFGGQADLPLSSRLPGRRSGTPGALRGHRRVPGAQGRRTPGLREPGRRSCSTATRGCSMTSPATHAASRLAGGVGTGAAERYWSVVRP